MAVDTEESPLPTLTVEPGPKTTLQFRFPLLVAGDRAITAHLGNDEIENLFDLALDRSDTQRANGT